MVESITNFLAIIFSSTATFYLIYMAYETKGHLKTGLFLFGLGITVTITLHAILTMFLLTGGILSEAFIVRSMTIQILAGAVLLMAGTYFFHKALIKRKIVKK